LPAAPVIVGGTGLYLTALTEGLAEVPPVPPAVRAEADARLAAGGLSAMLADVDAATAARIDRVNPARVQRAWEVLRATGRGLAAWQDAGAAPLLPLASAEAILLAPDRDRLAARIDRRFAAMLDAGALDEVRALLPVWAPAAPWARAIGAPELAAHLRGEIGLAEAAARARAATRQYAKRQRTWFRSRMGGWQRFDPG
jgi:tRNA dimethylallyltransferase